MDHGGTLLHGNEYSKEIGTMESKPAQNIQDTFLNTVRKDKSPITIYLVSGVKLTGKIRSFDKYSVLLENNSAGAADLQACDLDGGERAAGAHRRASAGSASRRCGACGQLGCPRVRLLRAGDRDASAIRHSDN